MKKLLAVCLFLALPALAQSNSQWTLATSTITYHITHPMHQVEGVSHAARGKGVCNAGQCDFLIAAPVKSFDSGDSNRDLHMLQVTRGSSRGRHFLLFSVSKTEAMQIDVLRILHDTMDFARHLPEEK